MHIFMYMYQINKQKNGRRHTWLGCAFMRVRNICGHLLFLFSVSQPLAKGTRLTVVCLHSTGRAGDWH